LHGSGKHNFFSGRKFGEHSAKSRNGKGKAKGKPEHFGKKNSGINVSCCLAKGFAKSHGQGAYGISTFIYMPKGLFIAGTGTGVGKSCVSAFLLSFLKVSGRKVLYYKPIQCGKPVDINFIKKMAKHKDTACSYLLKTPSSPHFAFDKEKIKFEKKTIKNFLAIAKKQYDFIFMEGAGGVRVPIARNFDMADLAKLSGFPVLLVAQPGLGTINHTLLSIDYLKSKNIEVCGFMFSWMKGVDFNSEIVLNNAETIEKISRIPFGGSVPKLM
jgi:dethiobiotin synthetase